MDAQEARPGAKAVPAAVPLKGASTHRLLHRNAHSCHGQQGGLNSNIMFCLVVMIMSYLHRCWAERGSANAPTTPGQRSLEITLILFQGLQP